MEKLSKNKGKKKKMKMGEFFQGRAGRNFLLAMEALLAVAFLLKTDLWYDPTAETFMKKFYADSLTICGGLWILLVILTVNKTDLSDRANRILTWFAAVTTPAVAFLWLEFYNDMQFWGPVFQIEPQYLLLDLLIYYAIYMLLLLVCNSVRGASIAMIIATTFFGIMNYELTVFRSMSFIASDIFSLLTAVSVANTYTPDIDVDTAEFFLLSLVLTALLFKLRKRKLFQWKGRIAYLALVCVMSIAFVQVYVFSDYLESIGVDFRVYRPQYKYRYYGTLLTTVRTFGYLHVTEPEGYSLEAVKKITEKYDARSFTRKELEQKDKVKAAVLPSFGEETGKTGASGNEKKQPNVIVVMNESFADLSVLGPLRVTEDYMPFFRSLKENTIKGYTYSSVFGGNTANSEFEFLTGNTMGFLPDNSVPYQLFLREKTAGLTYTMKNQGYSPCLALHPYFNTGYSRYKVYPLMGFDRFYTSDDFSVFTDTVNYHITDQEDYRKIISLYEQNRNSGKPFYLFNVTMQNHGSYTGDLTETGDRVRLMDGLTFFYRTTEFLNMIRMSDDALEDLITYFKKVDDPTVIVFFGDHQPDLDESIYNIIMGGDKSVNELEGEELEQLYKVPFMIWANYDIEEKTVERTSNNYLSTYLADVTGMERTGYLQYLSDLREKVPCINAIGYWGDDGVFYELDDKTSPYYELIHGYHLLEYNNLFGKEEQVSTFFYLSGHDTGASPGQVPATGKNSTVMKRETAKIAGHLTQNRPDPSD